MGKFIRSNLNYITVAFIVLVLFFLRFFNLTLLPIFADEAIYIRWAQVMKAEETLRFLPLSDGKQTLFMWMVIPLLKFISDPLMAGRMLSVIAGLGTLIGVATLSYLLFKNKSVSLVASLIYVLLPFSFFFDRLSLVDSVLTMFGIWTFIFSYLAVFKNRFDYSLLAGFALGGAWLTKSPAIFFALMLPLFLLFTNKKKFIYSTLYLIVTIVIGYGFYNILRLGPNFHLIASRNLDYVYPLSHFISSPFDPLKPFLLQSWQWIWMMGGVGLIIMWLVSYPVNIKKFRKELFILTVWFLVPIFVESEFAKVLTARYILFTLPYFIILAASTLTFKGGRTVRVLIYISIIFFVIQSFIFNFYLLTNPEKANLPRSERSGYLEEWTAGQGIKETADFIIDYHLSHPDEKIVIGTEGYFGTLPDGLQMYLNKYPKITVIGVGLNFTDIPKSLIESENFGNKTFLLINNDRYFGKPSKSGLVLIKEYPKAIRPDGTRESLLFFELSSKPR